ncbi:ATP-binding cassette domain-containing protein [Caproicibacterium lactatifermentans]|jgi:ribose transport system ATP-binding protein|uniref:ATP-binding cassette domain-containing protein n=2 Tax=Oscillospiraceae TaxID=216572 RepID=A0A859DWU4_9FIRM|nr:ATP-binding cassette domain-containing protein [Caproicibacterium lactatifermentans]QKO31124.1 ATP-binding cassette domain-containing protein [Caproicibacterium lactatifermentans]
MTGINKSFSGNQVLKNAEIDIAEGEIHALMGENGAGKSTLMKILTGVYTRDSGEVLVNGTPVNYTHPKQAEEAGIVFIYQELNSVPDLTVRENLFLGKEIHGKFGILDKAAMDKKARQVLDRLGVSIPVDRTMSELSVGQQQMIEIAKALLVDAKVIIMDEPTAAMTLEETRVLFRVLRELKEKGVSTIYISHRMEEIFEICDRVTVLRDGQFIGTKKVSETDMDSLIKMMIGREIGERYPARHSKIGDTMLEVKDFTKKGVFQNVSFSVRAGEVLGVSGLIGAGRTEIMQSIFGYLPRDGGTLLIRGKEVSVHSPEQAISYGIGFITEDRKTEGLMLEKSIRENVSLTNLGRISDHSVIDKKKDMELARKAVQELTIRCSGPEESCDSLSGGNQQKVIFSKWIFTEPKILILDEPTRGVDVGAKKEIYNIINTLAEKGVAVIMVSSELSEILGMSDRVMVIHEGHMAGILNNRPETAAAGEKMASQENIMTLATGGKLK